MGDWIYTSRIDEKFKNHRVEVQNATHNLIGRTFDRIDNIVYDVDNVVTKQVNKADKIIGKAVGKLDDVAKYAVDNTVKGIERSVATIETTTRHAVDTLDARVELSTIIVSDTIKESVKTIEDSLNTVDIRIKETFEAFSNMLQFSFLLCIMMFCVYQYGFQSLETLTQVLVYPSIIGIIIVCFSILIGRDTNTLVYTLFFLAVILIRYIYSHKDSKFMLKITAFESNSFYIELSFLAYYSFLYNQQNPSVIRQDYQCVYNSQFYHFSIFKDLTPRKLTFYILTFLLSFKCSFKIFEFEYLLTNLVILACFLGSDADTNNEYEFIKYLVYTVHVSNYFSVLISIWTWFITFFLTTILPASTSVGNFISLVSFLLCFLKYENSFCEHNWFGVLVTHYILFPLSLFISLIIKLIF